MVFGLPAELNIDSAASLSGDIGGRTPFSSPNSPEAFASLRRWIETCIKGHERCRQTISGIEINEELEPDLPSRVVDVGPPDGSREPRLIESEGMAGQYSALSHCWGPPSKRPLTTTKDTIRDRLRCMSWDSLPKTFRDAIEVTRAVGLRYMWIDSLCIIQDDHEDWLREAEKMGLIYQRARLTIAASHAKDGTDGCFLERTHISSAVEVPYINSDGQHLGSMFIQACGNPGDREPDSGPLGKRAWITQEWILARRVVFYTKSRLVWLCRSLLGDLETGRKVPISANATNWESIVHDYSRRHLTFTKDKLVALQGLANEIQKASSSGQYHFGIWSQDIPRHLLWRKTSMLTKSAEELQIPSWSWASKTGPVNLTAILPRIHDDVLGVRQHCGDVTIENDRTLVVEAQCKQITLSQKLVPVLGNSFPDVTLVVLDTREIFDWENIKPDWLRPVLARRMWISGGGSHHLIFDDNGSVLGDACLDEGIAPNETTYGLLLMSDLHNIKSREVNEGGQPWHREHILILIPRLPNINVFERVGAAVMFSLDGSSCFQDTPMRMVRIE